MRLPTASAAVLFAASLAHAQISIMSTELWTEVAPAKVMSILQEMKLDVSEKSGEKSTVFIFQLSGYKVSLDSHAGFMELQLALSDKTSEAAMNQWNRTHRFTRAYMDTDGGATLESDLDYGGGVAKATIESFIKGFGDVIPAFGNAVLAAGAAGAGTVAATPPPAPAPVPAAAAAPPAASGNTGGASGILTVLDGRMSVRYDPSKWKPAAASDPGRFEFSYVPVEGIAVVIAESVALSADKVADTAFANIRRQDSGARLTLKQKRRVAGADVWFQTVDATIKGTPVTYYGYYYGGQAGAVQLLTYTRRNLIGGCEKDFLEFLNGFRVAY